MKERERGHIYYVKEDRTKYVLLFSKRSLMNFFWHRNIENCLVNNYLIQSLACEMLKMHGNMKIERMW